MWQLGCTSTSKLREGEIWRSWRREEEESSGKMERTSSCEFFFILSSLIFPPPEYRVVADPLTLGHIVSSLQAVRELFSVVKVSNASRAEELFVARSLVPSVGVLLRPSFADTLRRLYLLLRFSLSSRLSAIIDTPQTKVDELILSTPPLSTPAHASSSEILVPDGTTEWTDVSGEHSESSV